MIKKSIYLIGLVVLLNCSVTKSSLVNPPTQYINQNKGFSDTIKTRDMAILVDAFSIKSESDTIINNIYNSDKEANSIVKIINNYENNFCVFKLEYEIITKIVK